MLSDIYVGASHPDLNDLRRTSLASSETMFSLLWQNGRLDHLEAKGHTIREDWLAGLQAIKPNGVAVHLESPPSRRVSVSPARRDTRTKQDFRETASPELSREEGLRCVARMREGHYLRSWVVDKSKIRGVGWDEIYLWFEGADSGQADQDHAGPLIFWCPAAAASFRPRQQVGAIPISELRDIFIGQEAPGFAEVAVRKAQDELCFSLVAQSASLHLQAPDIQTQETWVNGIQHVLSETGMTVTVTEDDSLPPSPRVASPVQKVAREPERAPTAYVTPAPTPDRLFQAEEAKKGIRSLRMGKSWIRYLPPAPSSASSSAFTTEEVFIFLDKDILYWCLPGTRLKSRDRCLPLGNILDIYQGRASPFFQRITGPSEKHCMSLVGLNNIELHLEAVGRPAKAETVATMWISAFASLLREDGRDLLPNNDKGEPRRYSVFQHNNENPSAVARAALINGYPFTRHFLRPSNMNGASFNQSLPTSGAPLEKEKIILWFQPGDGGLGALCWREATEGDNAGRGRGERIFRLPLQDLTDIFPHRKLELLQRKELEKIPEARCLVLKAEPDESDQDDRDNRDRVSKASCLCLSAGSKAQVEQFVLALREVIQEHGQSGELELEYKASSPTLEDMPTQNSFPSTPPRPAKQQDEVLSTAERQAFVQQMHQGSTLTLFKDDHYHDIFLFFRGPPSKGKIGTPIKEKSKGEKIVSADEPVGNLFWHVPGKPKEVKELELSKLSDIFLGRQTPRQKKWKTRQEGRSFKESLCFSLYGDGHELDLAAKNEVVFRAWTLGLQHILNAKEGSLVRAPAPSSSQKPHNGTEDRTQAASRQVAIEGLSRQQLEKMVDQMKVGAEFWVWTSGNKESVDVSQLRRYLVQLRLQTRPVDPETVAAAATHAYFTWIEIKPPPNKQPLSGALDLDALSSIFVGCHTTLFQAALSSPSLSSSSSPPKPVSEHCWSLVSDDGMQLNLEAINEKEMMIWVRGLRFFLQNSGPGLTVEEVPNSPARPVNEHEASFAVRDVPIGNHPSSPRADDAFSMLERGIPLLLLLLNSPPSPITQAEVLEVPIVLSVEPGPNGLPATLRAEPVPDKPHVLAGGRRLATEYFSLTAVADIFVGQTITDTLRAAKAPARNLLAIVGASSSSNGNNGNGTLEEHRMELNLQARSKAEVDLVLSALQAAFQRMGRGMASAPGQGQGDNGPRERMFSIIHKDLVPSLQLSLESRLSLLQTGLAFTLFSSLVAPSSPPSTAAPVQVLLFADLGKGLLYWVPSTFHGTAAEAFQTTGSQRMFPVEALADLFMGRLPSTIPPGLSTDLCLTLVATNKPAEPGMALPLPGVPVGASLQWGLAASSALELAALLAGLDGLIYAGGNAIVVTDDNAGEENELAGPRLTDSAGLLTVDFLRREILFVRWFQTSSSFSAHSSPSRGGPSLKWEQVLVWLEPAEEGGGAAVCWKSFDYGHQSVGGGGGSGRFSLSRLAAVEVGKRGQFLRSAPSTVSADRCLTLLADNPENAQMVGGDRNNSMITLCLEAPTVSALNLIVVAIAHLLTDMQSRMYQEAMPQQGSSEEGWSPALEQRLVQGTVLSALSVSANGRLSRKRVLFFYQPDPAGQLGRFCWSGPERRDFRQEWSFRGTEITDVFFGIESPTFRHPVSAECDPSRCFSIGTQSLLCDFEADEPRVRALWTMGIAALLAHHGRRQAGYGSGYGERLRRVSYLPGTAANSPAKLWPRGQRLDGLATDDYPPMQAEEQEAVVAARMEAGALMTMHDGSGSQSVFVFVRKGALCWCGPQERRTVPSQSLPLSELCLVLPGKQDIFWRSGLPAATAAAPASCFTVQTLSGPKLHLEAHSTESGSLWVAGLSRELKAAEESRRSPYSASDTLNVSGETRSEVADSRQEEAFQALLRGRRFLLWEISSSQQASALAWREITLSYDPAQRAFIVHPGLPGLLNQSSTSSTVLRIRRITDVYWGKKTEILKRAALASVADKDCVAIAWSLKSGSGSSERSGSRTSLTLNLQAVRPGDAAMVVDALAHISKILGKPMKSKQQGDMNVPYRLPAGLPLDPATVMHRMQTHHPPTVGIDPTPTISMMSRGCDMWLLYRDQYQKRVTRRRQRVFVLPAPRGDWPAGLYWSDPGGEWTGSSAPPVPLPGRCIPLADVLAIYLAKETPVRADPSCPVDRDECCWSVVGNQQTVDFEAPSLEYLTAFIFGLLALRPGEKSGGSTAGSVAEALTAGGAKLDISRGEFFTSLINLDGRRFRREQVKVSLQVEDVTGRVILQWRPDAHSTSEYTQTLAVDRISDILFGADAPSFQSAAGMNADPACCLTILGADGTRLDLVASSEAKRRGLAALLFDALRNLGKTVTTADSAPVFNQATAGGWGLKSGMSSSSSSSSQADQPVQPGNAARAVQEMVKGAPGRVFVSVDPKTGREAEARPVFLFYEPHDAGGTVYWSAPHSRRKDPQQALRLYDLSDVYLGKEHPFWRALPPSMQASLPLDSFCFSLIGADGLELHFAAESEATVLNWSAAIQVLTRSDGTAKADLENQALRNQAGAYRDQQMFDKQYLPQNSGAREGERWLSPPVDLAYYAPSPMPPTPLATMQAIMSGDPIMSRVDPSLTIAMLHNGRVFTRFSQSNPGGQGKGRSELQVETVRLFFLHESSEQDGMLGSLYWCEPHLRVARPHCRFDLALTDEIILGKLTPALTQASDAQNTRCFSLMRVDGGAALDLEAESEAMLSCWLYGINCLLDVDGKEVNGSMPSVRDSPPRMQLGATAGGIENATTGLPNSMASMQNHYS
eukprot:gb/GEZN01000038.1/.p1 GENE.gb/GEZN01000038.1/~~gb/GEZN01000038.1/.p1  ORF type:complete len:3253 (-),score=565.38 gb/GEZN01000038.1/:497-8857(-)